MSRVVIASVTAVALMVSLHPLAARQPTFRSGVDLVTVDATVLGSDGTPIATLGPDDFTLDVDGRRRRVVSAQFVSQATRESRAIPLPAAHFSSNEASDPGRVVVVAVDEAHIRRLEGRPAFRAAEQFLDALAPSDRVGVTGLARLGSIEFSRDRLAIRNRLAALVGEADPVFMQFNLGLSEAVDIAEGSRTRLADAVLRECGRALTEYVNLARAADDAGGARDACPEQVEQESRALAQQAHIQARISLSALEALVVSLKDLPGPKTIVLLSEGMIADPRRVDLGRLAAEAHLARVTIYALHLEVPTYEAAQDRVSPTAIRDLQVRADGLARVTGAARGAVFRLVGNDPRPFARIARELSGYYLLAFEPLDTERDGRSHRIRVRLARGGGELRARPGFVLPATSPPARDTALVQLLRSSSPATELPLRVATYTYAESASRDLRVVVSAEASASTRVGLGFVLIDAGGVIAASAVHDAGGGAYAFSTTVPPGNYLLRVAAIDPMGRRGTVERPFTARLAEAAGIRVSDLMLARVPARPNDALEPLIDRVTTSAVVAYLELHAQDRAALPDTVRIVVTSAGDDRPLVVVPATLARADAAWAVARATVPLAALPPGSYVARAEVMSASAIVARVVRPFTVAPR
jgi:VWFA-related protein